MENYRGVTVNLSGNLEAQLQKIDILNREGYNFFLEKPNRKPEKVFAILLPFFYVCFSALCSIVLEFKLKPFLRKLKESSVPKFGKRAYFLQPQTRADLDIKIDVWREL